LRKRKSRGGAVPPSTYIVSLYQNYKPELRN
jgi:hypothetical protein